MAAGKQKGKWLMAKEMPQQIRPIPPPGLAPLLPAPLLCQAQQIPCPAAEESQGSVAVGRREGDTLWAMWLWQQDRAGAWDMRTLSPELCPRHSHPCAVPIRAQQSSALLSWAH